MPGVGRTGSSKPALFAPYLFRWSLVPDGEPITTHSSHLLPVTRDGQPLVLKVPVGPEERAGAGLMLWWSGDGAARVMAHDDGVILLERAMGERSLAAMARSAQDDGASQIICSVASRLHAPRDRPGPELVPLTLWFEPLEVVARAQGGLLREASDAAQALLSEPQDASVLHGDLHHANVLDFGPGRGWLAIDPKGLMGERAFDFANLLRNPDQATATAPGRMGRQAKVIADAACLDRSRLLRWTLAYAGLSAAWNINDGATPSLDLAAAEIAAAELR
jgi:streptomycin 6-kinase